MNKQEDAGELSTTALGKRLNMNTQDMFQQLFKLGLVSKNGTEWALTPFGENKGGTIKRSAKFGDYIVWPQSIISELGNVKEEKRADTVLINATNIGKHFDISADRINSTLSELGWIKKDIKGWRLTELGNRIGGVQSKHKTTGIPYVHWPENIIKNNILLTSIREAKGEISTAQDQIPSTDTLDFREKFKAEHRAQDGHYVRSKAELIVDNWLYVSKIVHAYERKLPIEEGLYCDFYIPTGKVYIEYWGSEDEKYLARKEKKREIYKKYDLNLIELFEKDISNLDDTLPAKLLQFEITVE